MGQPHLSAAVIAVLRGSAAVLLGWLLRWSWGQRIYALVVLATIVVFACAGVNHFRVRCYEALHQQIAAAGGKSTRSITMLSDPQEAYFMAVQGDFSAVAVTGVMGTGPRCSIDGKLLRRMKAFPEISELRLSRMQLAHDDYRQLYSLENLTRLNLSYSNLGDTDLEGIEKLAALEYLDLQFTRITDASLPRLTRLRELNAVDLTGTDVTPAGVERLQKDLKDVPGRSQAATVTYRQTPSDRFRQAVIRIQPTSSYSRDPRGTGMRLLLRRDAWTGLEKEIPALGELTDVESVVMQKMELSPILLDTLATLPKLHSISVSDVPLPAGELSPLGKSRSLRILRISAATLDERFISSLGALGSLESLTLFNCRLSPGACLALAELDNISSLSLRQVTVDPVEWDFILSHPGRLRKLRLLDLANMPIDDHSLRHFAKLPQLVSLGLAGTRISDAGVPDLCAMSHLQQLDITATKISDSGISDLEAAMGDHGGLVVYPHSKVAKSPLSLTELTAKAQARVTAATSEPQSAGSGSR